MRSLYKIILRNNLKVPKTKAAYWFYLNMSASVLTTQITKFTAKNKSQTQPIVLKNKEVCRMFTLVP